MTGVRDKDDKDWGAYYFSPQQLANVGLEHIKLCVETGRGGYGIVTHIQDLQGHMLPHVPGRYCLVVGDSGNGKTFVMSGWANAIAKGLGDASAPDYSPNRVVVYVSLEDPVETHAIARYAAAMNVPRKDILLGKVSPDDPRTKAAWTAVQMGGLYFVGVSIGKKMGDLYGLTSADVYEIIYSMVDDGLEPQAVFVDYMTAFATRQRVDRLQQINDDSAALVKMSTDLAVPVVVAAQSRRDRQHDIGSVGIPQIGDVEYGYVIAQRATKAFGVWMPSRASLRSAAGTTMPAVSIAGREVLVTPELIVVCIIKQNDGESQQTVPCLMNFVTGGIDRWIPPATPRG